MLKKLPFALLLIPTLIACEAQQEEDVGEEVGEVIDAVGDPDKKVGEELGEAANAVQDKTHDTIDELQKNSDS